MKEKKIPKENLGQWKTFIEKLLFPHGFFVFLLFNLTVVLLVYSLGYSKAIPAVQYASYGISSYTLVIVCARIPGLLCWWKNRLYRNKLTARYLTEKDLRERISLHIGIGVDILFAVFKMTLGILYESTWLMAVAVYYMVLGAMHFTLLKKDREIWQHEDERMKRFHEFRGFRMCGFMMFILNAAMSGILFKMIWQDHGYSYPGFTVYAFSAYAFYCLISVIVKLIKYRHIEKPIVVAAKSVSLAKALMSFFIMQTVLIAQFGADTSEKFRMIMNTFTSVLACLIVFFMAVMMVVKANEEIRKLEGVS